MKQTNFYSKPVLWCVVLLLLCGLSLNANDSYAFDDDDDSFETTKSTDIIDAGTGYCNLGWWRHNLLLTEMKYTKSHPEYLRMKKESITCTAKEDEMARKGDIEAIYRIASRHSGGYGIYDYDREKKRQLLEKILKETDKNSKRYKNIKTSLKALQQHEKNGRPNIVPANIMKTMALAFKYWKGFDKNIPKDIEKAKLFYEQVRQAGYAEGTYNLYQLNEGTEKGKQFLIDAAENGWVPAMGTLAFNLSMKKYKGFERDLDAADKWAKLTVEKDPNNYSAKLALKSIPSSRKHEQKMFEKQAKRQAEIERKQILEHCRNFVKTKLEEKQVNGHKQVTLQSATSFIDIYGSHRCPFTITGIKNKSGQWDGPYKVVRDLDGFEIFKGHVKNEKLNGQLVALREFPYGRDVKRNSYAGATSFLTLGPPINVNSATVAFELFDYDFLKKRNPRYYFQKITIVNNKIINMKELTADGVLLYDGTAFRSGENQKTEIEESNSVGGFVRYGEKWFALHYGASRLDGSCLYEGKMEPCTYRYVNKLVGKGEVLRRMDPIGQQRRRQFLADLKIQMRNYEYAKQKVARLTSARERKEAREKQESAARQARDKANRERWKREEREYANRIQQDAERTFNRTFSGGLSGGSSSDINDPLNPNNPINRQMQQQTQRALRNHNNKQAQAKHDYQTKLAQRQREIAAQKKASVDRRLAQQRLQQSRVNKSSQSTSNKGLSGPGSTRYSTPATTHKPFMTSKVEDQHAKGRGGWDCVNHWRADKCGDRITTHTIHPMASGVTGEDKKINQQSGTSSQSNNSAESSTGTSSAGSTGNAGNGSGAGEGKKENETVKSSKQLTGDSDSYFYNKKHAIDLAQTEIMNQASKYCSTSYKVKLSWHDNKADCKKLNKQFRCTYHATVSCLSESCGSSFCGTGR